MESRAASGSESTALSNKTLTWSKISNRCKVSATCCDELMTLAYVLEASTGLVAFSKNPGRVCFVPRIVTALTWALMPAVSSIYEKVLKRRKTLVKCFTKFKRRRAAASWYARCSSSVGNYLFLVSEIERFYLMTPYLCFHCKK
jgi:hypothetical protein